MGCLSKNKGVSEYLYSLQQLLYVSFLLRDCPKLPCPYLQLKTETCKSYISLSEDHSKLVQPKMHIWGIWTCQTEELKYKIVSDEKLGRECHHLSEKNR